MTTSLSDRTGGSQITATDMSQNRDSEFLATDLRAELALCHYRGAPVGPGAWGLHGPLHVSTVYTSLLYTSLLYTSLLYTSLLYTNTSLLYTSLLYTASLQLYSTRLYSIYMYTSLLYTSLLYISHGLASSPHPTAT